MAREPAWKRLGLKVKNVVENDPLSVTHLEGSKPKKQSKKVEEPSKKRPAEEDPKKQKKAPKRKKLPKNERPPPPEKDQLAYLRHFSKDRDSWKFSKQKQNWVLRNIEHIPDDYEGYLFEYVGTMKGGSRERVASEMKEVVEKWQKSVVEAEVKKAAKAEAKEKEAAEEAKKAAETEKAESNEQTGSSSEHSSDQSGSEEDSHEEASNSSSKANSSAKDSKDEGSNDSKDIKDTQSNAERTNTTNNMVISPAPSPESLPPTKSYAVRASKLYTLLTDETLPMGEPAKVQDVEVTEYVRE